MGVNVMRIRWFRLMAWWFGIVVFLVGAYYLNCWHVDTQIEIIRGTEDTSQYID